MFFSFYIIARFFYVLKDYLFFVLPAIFLSVIGIISLYYYPHTQDLDNYEKQIIFLLAAIILSFIISIFDYRAIVSNSYLLLFIYGFFILSLVGLFFFSETIRGIQGWYTIGPFSFDPSQFLQIIVLIIIAKYFSSKYEKAKNKIAYIIISGLYVFLPFLLIMLQPNLGTAIIFILIWLSFLFLAGAKKIYTFLILFALIISSFFAWNYVLQDYQKERILSFISQEKDILGSAWNQYQSQVAIGSSSFFGKGLGQGTQTRLGFLPEAHTDFMFSAIVEELGLFGAILIFGLFVWLFYNILRVVLSLQDRFSYFFCFGYVILILIYIILNIGSNIGTLPVIGISLPFVSYGGSFLLSLFLGLGLINSIKNHKNL